MTNIVENPNVGLLFLVPGFDDTLRVNGKATIVRDDALAQATVVNGKEPKIGIRVEVEEAFLALRQGVQALAAVGREEQAGPQGDAVARPHDSGADGTA